MSFAPHFNESISESQMTPNKREMETSQEPSKHSAKKRKSPFGNEKRVRNAPESAFEEQEYSQEDFMSSPCKPGNNLMAERPMSMNSSSQMEDIMRKLAQDAKMTVMKWLPLFGESEAFEACCAGRLDEILKQALDLEQNLIEQKECLRARMKAVSRTLQAS